MRNIDTAELARLAPQYNPRLVGLPPERLVPARYTAEGGVNDFAAAGVQSAKDIKGERGTIWEATGPRLHHFGYWTDDLEGDVDRLVKEGWRLELTMPGSSGKPTVFAYLIRDDGFRIELIDDPGREDYTSRLARDE